MKPLFYGILIGAVLAVLLRAFRVVTPSGAFAGAALVAAFIALGGEVLFAGFALLVVLGTLASSLGKEAKRRRGVPKVASGPRDAGQALANGGPGLLLLICGAGPVPALAALAAALADTAAGEVGMLRPGEPRLLLFGPKVPVGTNGGMTWFGMGAGVVAGLGHALLALGEPSGLLGALALLIGATAGQVLDSVLGATIEQALPARWANDAVNAAASLCGGLTTLWLLSAWSLA